MANEAEELVAGILAMQERLPDSAVNAGRRRGRTPSESAFAQLMVAAYRLPGGSDLQAAKEQLGDLLAEVGLPPAHSLRPEGDVFSLYWYCPRSWLGTLERLTWHQLADIALLQLYAPCCGPPPILIERADDDTLLLTECVVCKSRWRWQDVKDEKKVVEGWTRIKESPNGAERKAAFAPYLQAADEAPRGDDLTPLERAIVESDENPELDIGHRLALALDAGKLFVPGLPLGGGLTAAVRGIEDDELGLTLIAFTRPAWFRRALWRHPEWFADALPVELEGQDVRRRAADQGAAIWINPKTDPFAIVLDPAEPS